MILVVGTPGSGKTTFANTLSCHLAGIPVICTDIIKVCFEEKSPTILSKVSHTAWELVGECTDENIIAGYQMFARELFHYSLEVAKKMFETYNTIIIEGLGIAPDIVQELPYQVICIHVTNKHSSDGYMNKLVYRTKKVNNWTQKEWLLNIIGEFIKAEFKKQEKYLSIDIQDSDKAISYVIQQLNGRGCTNHEENKASSCEYHID